MKDYIETLRAYELKITPQRELIFKLLAQSKEHPTAEFLFEKLKHELPAVSLNTVYKTLDLFERKGLVKRFIINIGENVYHYDANTLPHAHIICINCGRVDDINGEIAHLMDKLKNKAAENTDYRIMSTDLYLYGICPVCKS